jgi:hypothetical protein
MSAEIDRGPVIVQRKVELEPWESSIKSTIYALVDSATELFRETWDDLADGSFTFKNPDPRSGSSHRFKDTQEIRDVVNRFADAPIPIFLQEVKARMAVSPSHQPDVRAAPAASANLGCASRRSPAWPRVSRAAACSLGMRDAEPSKVGEPTATVPEMTPPRPARRVPPP